MVCLRCATLACPRAVWTSCTCTVVESAGAERAWIGSPGGVGRRPRRLFFLREHCLLLTALARLVTPGDAAAPRTSSQERSPSPPSGTSTASNRRRHFGPWLAPVVVNRGRLDTRPGNLRAEFELGAVVARPPAPTDDGAAFSLVSASLSSPEHRARDRATATSSTTPVESRAKWTFLGTVNSRLRRCLDAP